MWSVAVAMPEPGRLVFASEEAVISLLDASNYVSLLQGGRPLVRQGFMETYKD